MIDTITLTPGSVVIFRFSDDYAKQLTAEDRARVSDWIQGRMGSIPFLVLPHNLDMTILIPTA